MDRGREKVHPRECVDEVFRVLTTSKKIWIPFILAGIISVIFLAIEIIFREFYLKDIIMDASGYFMIMGFNLGSVLFHSLLSLLIIPSYLLMYDSISKYREPSFRKAFVKGLKYYPKLMLAYLIMFIITTVLSGILNISYTIFINILGIDLVHDFGYDLFITGSVDIPIMILTMLYLVLFLVVYQSIVLGKKGALKGIEESVRVGFRNYLPLLNLLFFFTMFRFLLRYILNIIELFHDDQVWLLLLLNVLMVPLVAFIGIFSTLVYTSFYLKYKKIERSGS